MKRFFLILLCLTILCGCSVFNKQEDSVQITSSDQLKGKTIGINTGSVYENYIRQHYTDSKYSYFNSRPELILALKSKKISAFLLDDYTAIQYMKKNNFRDAKDAFETISPIYLNLSESTSILAESTMFTLKTP